MSSPLSSTDTPKRRRTTARRNIGIWVWIAAICLTAMVATYILFVEPPPPRKIVIASGSQNGAYYRFASQYAEELRKDGLTVEVRETAGSVENLQLLEQKDSEVSIAIIQGGVARPDETANLDALGSLYHEPLWVFYRSDKPIERIADLAGKRIGVGPPGSGTYAVALTMLTANGLIPPESPGAPPRATLVQEKVAAAATALQKAELDAAFFVAAFDAEYIQTLLNDKNIRLLNFSQREAYHRRFRYLAPVTLPSGMANLVKNIPSQDVSLLAPTAMLVVRKTFHPALVPLLLTTATRIHGKGDVLSEPGKFPSRNFCDFPLSEDAKRFYQNGQPVLQRLLPFWLASLADRAKVMLIPLVMLMMPLMRAAPPLMRWRTRRKIYLWYSDLREIDQQLLDGLTSTELDQELAHLKKIEHQVAFVDVPLSYMEEVYHLRLHLRMMQDRLTDLRARGAS